MTTINLELLAAIKAAIVETPTQFHIGDWHDGDIAPNVLDKVSGLACFAGWAVVLHDRQRLSQCSGEYIQARAKELLGLSEDEAARLFFCGLWPWELYEPYCHEPETWEDFQANALLAARRIEVFIATGGTQ